MAQTAINLALLPPPQVIEQIDFETILTAMQADLIVRGTAVGIDLAPVLALESEPCKLLLEVAAYRETVIRNSFNLRAQGCMLAYATGGDLDNLAANLDATRNPGELDPTFLARAVEAPNGWAVAGPLAAYDYIARNADPTVADIYVSSPTPGQVQVMVLSTTGAASAQLLATVSAALNADTVRPFTDQVVVISANVVVYNVTAQLTISSGPDEATVLGAAQAAVTAYGAAQAKIGKLISLTALGGALVQSGVEDATISSPAATIAAVPGVAPILGTVTLTAVVDPTNA